MSKNLTTEEFIARSKEIHGDKYDYSQAVYVEGRLKVRIRCKLCDFWFDQRACNHTSGRGCHQCKKNTLSSLNVLSKDQFVAVARAIHGDEFDYSETVYSGMKTRIRVRCNKCGVAFEQLASNHANARGWTGCKVCSGEKIGSRLRLGLRRFVDRSIAVHGDIYDYSRVVYKNVETKVPILCKTCGLVFDQTPTGHLSGYGCPCQSDSRGEKMVARILDRMGATHVRQASFPGCVNVLPLRFDFYLPDHNAVIEYHGEHHYIANRFFGGEDSLVERKRLDKIKVDFCEASAIRYVEIPYTAKEQEVFLRIRELLTRQAPSRKRNLELSAASSPHS